MRPRCARDAPAMRPRCAREYPNFDPTESYFIRLARIDKNIVVACMSSAVHTFHIKGKRVHSIYLPAPARSKYLLARCR